MKYTTKTLARAEKQELARAGAGRLTRKRLRDEHHRSPRAIVSDSKFLRFVYVQLLRMSHLRGQNTGNRRMNLLTASHNLLAGIRRGHVHVAGLA